MSYGYLWSLSLVTYLFVGVILLFLVSLSRDWKETYDDIRPELRFRFIGVVTLLWPLALAAGLAYALKVRKIRKSVKSQTERYEEAVRKSYIADPNKSGQFPTLPGEDARRGK